MQNRILFFLTFFIITFSCKNENKDKINRTVNKIHEKGDEVLKTKGSREEDFFNILSKYLNPKFSLFSIKSNDFDNTIDNFINNNFDEVKTNREARYKIINDKSFLFVKEFIFDNKKYLSKIIDKLKRGIYKEMVEIEGDKHEIIMYYIKEPNTFFVTNDSKLYIFYVKSEYDRKYIASIEKVLNNRSFIDQVAPPLAPE